MSQLTIKAKMTLLAALFAVGLGAFVTVIFMTTADNVGESDYSKVIELKDALADVMPPPLYVLESWAVAEEVMDHVDDKARIAQLTDVWRSLEKDQRTRRDYWAQNLTVSEARAPLAEVTQSAERFFAIGNNELLPAAMAGDKVKIETAMDNLEVAYKAQRATVDRFVALATQVTDREVATAASDIRRRKLLSAFFGALLALTAGGMGLLIARDVAKRMRESVALLGRVAQGDLTARMDASTSDEIGDMAIALNEAFESVHEALTRVQTVASTLASTATDLSGSAEEISSGAQQQASSLEETAASLEQITATVRQSAGNAQQASQLAEQSRDVATQGGGVVSEAVTAMEEVTRASRRIGDIITTIDEIALQTNLLALNAAVEAARAGEQGRGFAVVAAEVGSLAQRSAAAAKEVKNLIEDTLERVSNGHALVGRSGQALGEIITSVKRVTDIVGEIASASREQSAGVEQVNQAVTQMDQVTQSNAAQTDALSQTAGSLASAASELHQLVGQFQLRGGSSDEAQTREAAPPRRKPEPAKRRQVARPARQPQRSPSRERANTANGHWPAGVEGGDDQIELL
jgi:methyl-accepting chemotaxis protein